jgi:hypothetical protein
MLAVALAGLLVAARNPVRSAGLDVCGWQAPVTARTVTVKNTGDLFRAVAEARPETTILIADGEYQLDRTLTLGVPGLVLRGKTGDRSKVIIRGGGMTEDRVGIAIAVAATHITIADLTVGYVGYHGIQVHGERGASNMTVHNVRIVDTGQQLLKGSTSAAPVYADDGLIACSLFEYTDHAPGNYTNGVDVLAGKGWTVRDSEFRRIRGLPEQRFEAGPAILFWANSQDTVIERNTILDSFRGIALGLGPGASSLPRGGDRQFDHQGGSVRNNVVYNLASWADEGIEANAARDIAIDHNTVLVEGHLAWSIKTRFPSTTGSVRNNLTNRRIMLLRDAQIALSGNVDIAERAWFFDPMGGNLRLAGPNTPAVHAGVALPIVAQDFDRRLRSATRPDAGAFEYVPRESR